MKNIMKDLTGYRVRVERDGKEVVNIPGILCLPGLLAAPKMSIFGMIAAPLLGCSIHVENEAGREADVEESVQKSAETFVDTAKTAVRTIREEIDKAWQAMSAEDQPETDDAAAQGNESVQDAPEVVVEDPEEDIPAIRVNPDDSEKA